MTLPEFDVKGIRSTRSPNPNRALVELVEERFHHEAVHSQRDLKQGKRRNFSGYSGPSCTECGSEVYKTQVWADCIQVWCAGCRSEYSRTDFKHAERTGLFKVDVTTWTVWSQRSPELAQRRWTKAHPPPSGADFFGYCAFGPRGSVVSGPDYSIARAWPSEHRIYRLLADRQVAFAETQMICGWFLRSPVDGVDVRQLLCEIERRRDAGSGDPMASVVSEVLADAARGVDMQDAEGRLGERWLAVFDPSTEHSSLKISSSHDASKETLEIDIVVGDATHQIVHSREGNKALSHRNLKTSRGVTRETCPACHEVLLGLEAFRDASVDEIHSWTESGIDLRAAAEWQPFATPQHRNEWIKIGFDQPTAAAWAPTCGPAAALARAESNIQPN